MIDPSLVAHLDARALKYCLIGATALSAHGFARYTADVDLLTMSELPLSSDFWAGFAGATANIVRGDYDDPFAGVVRFHELAVPHELLVGRGYAMLHAVQHARQEQTVGCPVASPLSLVLLKLVAGGPQDAFDIISFLDVQAALGKDDWVTSVDEHLSKLPIEAQGLWKTLREKRS